MISSNGTTGDLSLIWRHISAVHEERKGFKCKIYEKSFSYKSKMEKHMTSIHEGKQAFNLMIYQIILNYYSLNVYVISTSLLLSMKRHEGYHAWGIPNDFYALYVSVYGIHFTESTVVQSS